MMFTIIVYSKANSKSYIKSKTEKKKTKSIIGQEMWIFRYSFPLDFPLPGTQSQSARLPSLESGFVADSVLSGSLSFQLAAEARPPQGRAGQEQMLLVLIWLAPLEQRRANTWKGWLLGMGGAGGQDQGKCSLPTGFGVCWAGCGAFALGCKNVHVLQVHNTSLD